MEDVWRTVREVVHQLSPEDWPVAASLYYYTITSVFASILRSITKSLLPASASIYILDLITTFQFCACSLENANVRYYHGMPGFAVALFGLSILYTLTFKGCRGNPLANLVDSLSGKQSFTRTLIRIIFQLWGGLMSYRYARTFWSLELNIAHVTRLHALHCTTDLTVSPELGFTIEFLGSMLEIGISITTFTNYAAAETGAKILIGVLTTLWGVGLTGYYINPVNATNQTFGCAGTSALTHMLIYWVGPFLATALTVYLKHRLSSRSSNSFKKDRKPSGRRNGTKPQKRD